MTDSEWESSSPHKPGASTGHRNGFSDDFKSARRQKSTLADPTQVDRLPPHSIEAEQGVLGCILLEPAGCIPICVEKMGSSADVFYDLRHKALYEALLEMNSSQRAIDLVTLQQALSDKQQLEGVGGLVYLASLPDAVPSAANLDYYIEILREKHVLRRLVGTCTEIVGRIYEHQDDVGTLLDEVERDIGNICRRDNTSKRVSPEQAVARFADDLERRWLNDGSSGIITNMREFDRYNEGLQPGEMFVLGARPSQGKTALALHVLDQACLTDEIKTDFISLEMSSDRLIRRLAARRCRIPMANLVHGNIGDEEFARLAQFNQMVAAKPVTFHDYSGERASIQLVVSLIRRAAAGGTKLVIIDYLTLIDGIRKSNSRAEEKRHEIGYISNALKRVTKETGVAMLALAQLNREADKGDTKTRKPRVPRVSDLAESGQIERDADVIGLIYRDEAAPSMVNLLIRKNRDGMSGYNIGLNFNMQYQEFTPAVTYSTASD